MSFSKYFIILISFILISFSCEDTKSRKTNSAKTKPSKENKQNINRDSLLQSVKIPSGGDKTDIDIAGIKTVEQEELIPFLTEYGKENPETRVLISTDFGDIEVQLFTDTPLHRANFIRLVKIGYFSTTFFHRVSKGFVVQGGNSDNRVTQRVRSAVGDYLIPNEFRSNHLHNRGAFSAAKYSEQNVSKASSPFEFFIVQGENSAHHLDNDHTVFGKVVRGMDVVDKIAEVETDASEWPKKNVGIREVKILD